MAENLKRITIRSCDILIIGSGSAGLRAAIEAHDAFSYCSKGSIRVTYLVYCLVFIIEILRVLRILASSRNCVSWDMCSLNSMA